MEAVKIADTCIERAFKQIASMVGKAKYDLSDEEYSRCLPYTTPNPIAYRYLQYAQSLSRARAENKKSFTGFDYKIVSLGENCLPRTVMTRWGIKPKRNEGELSMPFDLAIHKASNIYEIISSGFQGYLGKLKYQNETNTWINPDLSIRFNHDKDMGSDDLELLTTRYEKRISNFYQVIESAGNVLFIQVVIKDRFSPQILTVLERLRKGKPFKLAIIDATGNVKNVPNEAFLLSARYPYPEYKWSVVDHFGSVDGEHYERKIVEGVKTIIRDHFPSSNM